MKKFSFKYKTEINQPLNKVFDFYSDPKKYKPFNSWVYQGYL